MSDTICWTEDPQEIKQLQQHLLAEVQSQFGNPERRHFTWVIRSTQAEIIGGISGYSHWKWSYISQLWVHPSLQGKGLGTRLLETVEEWSKSQQFLGLYIDTFETKVMCFYQKRGYQLVGQIPDFPEGHQRYFLFRTLRTV